MGRGGTGKGMVMVEGNGVLEICKILKIPHRIGDGLSQHGHIYWRRHLKDASE